ncbi:MAG: PhzF family phenazine biosynthesis protein [Planctomycetes bacterium]|nr:PhzF family phenazine biosynthesis protein [Planctomycetota bacterium]MCD7895592.1 PhzF family phenazine biosynthesis protein [Planctomycetaceae bacterium]
MNYYHVDVFATAPFAGNGLTVVFPDADLPDATLLAITREFKQFETIFLYPCPEKNVYPARIFTVDEELPFAGHPVIGAGAVLHRLFHAETESASFELAIGGRRVPVRSRRESGRYRVTMDQGEASFRGPVDPAAAAAIASALSLEDRDINADWPIEVVSTGLRYLLVPLRSGLDRCRIRHDDFESFLGEYDAQFVYVFDTATLECRTWGNVDHAEDVATGSAAGPLAAYLVKHGKARADETIAVRQGRFVKRPSVIQACVTATGGDTLTVSIAGDVAPFASGSLTFTG